MNNSPGWASPGSDSPDASRPDTSAAAPDGPEETSPSAENANPGGTDSGAGPGGTPESGTPGAPRAAAEQGAPRDTPPPNWSANQPPPANWSPQDGGTGQRPPSVPGQYVPPPPPGPSLGAGPGPGAGGPGRPGWGGMPGGQYPYWSQPPAPKPGVIPLRPLAFNDIFNGAISTVRIHWRTVLSISVVVAVLTVTASTLVTGLFFNQNPNLDKIRNEAQPSLSDLAHIMGTALADSAVPIVIGLLGQIIATAMLITIVSRSVIGRPVTAQEVWRDARPRIPQMLGLTLLLVLIGVGTIAVGIAPGLLIALNSSSRVAGAGLAILGGLVAAGVSGWLLISFYLSPPALMLEKQGVLASLSRSFRLVRGAWWRVAGIQLLASLIFFIANTIVQVPFGVIATLAGGETTSSLLSGGGSVGWTTLIITGVGTVIGSTFTLPLGAGITSLLYMDQRIRREGLDIELARAAGIPGYHAK